jgi:hypothetical protein
VAALEGVVAVRAGEFLLLAGEDFEEGCSELGAAGVVLAEEEDGGAGHAGITAPVFVRVQVWLATCTASQGEPSGGV